MAQQAVIKSLVGYDGKYVFPLEQESYQTNFANVKTRTVALAGFDGGFDELGSRRGVQEIGNVQVYCKLIASAGATTQRLADEWRRIAGWGISRLFMVPLGTTNAKGKQRWAQGRLTYGAANMKAADQPDVYVDASAQFNVPDPGWYGIEPAAGEPAYNASGNLYFDDDNLLDGSWVWGGARAVATLNAGQKMTVRNSGTRLTRPIITIQATAAMSGFGMARYDQFEQVIDEWRYNGVLAIGDRLVVDCQAFSVIKREVINDVNAFADFTIVTGLGWHELPPKQTVLEMRGTATGALVSVDFYDSWY